MPRILKQKEIRKFHDTGFLKIEGFFYPNELNAMSNAIDRIKTIAENLPPGEPRYNGSKFYTKKFRRGIRIEHVNWCGATEPWLMHYSRETRLTFLVSQLLESDKANHLINQIHYKLPGDYMKFPFHQDSKHRRYGTNLWKDVNGKGSYVNVITAIDEMTPYNGPLLISENPGGHIGEISEGDQERHRRIAVPMLMEPGDLLIMGPYVIHGSFANNSDKSRRILINGFSYPGANLRKFNIPNAGELISLLES